MREMKDSGVRWIGKVPSDWIRKKVKNVASLIGSGTTPTSTCLQYYESEDVNWIQSGDIYGVDTVVKTTTMVSNAAVFSLSALHVYKPDFIVVAMYGGSVGNIAVSKIEACVNQACCCIQTDNQNDLKFMYYWIYMCKSDFLRVSEGGGQPNISQAKIRNQYYIQPPIAEQQRIANFLDAKCAEIDTLTADIQAQIDTLEQYKRSVITETVTKGLNPDAEMKDSGIEWVGQIPMSWKVLKGKHLFAQRSLRGNSIELQLLSPTQRFGVIPQALYEELTGMSAVKLNEKADLSLLKTIHKRDFCISLRSFQGGFEYSEYEGVVSPAYQVFYPTVEIADGYYKYLFKEQGFIEKMNSYTMTLRDGKNIAFSDFGSTYVPYPPLREQAEIAAYLNKKCDQTDVLIAEKRQQLATLNDYKKSLIFEYVTGKKGV